jgi:hypothetical protein
MLCRSISSVHIDPYRAGTEIGTALREVNPEVIILFASITYESEVPDFFDGLYDSLGPRDVLVFGGTGDGVYETTGSSHYGVSAMGLNSEGRIQWSLSVETGVGSDSYTAAKNCAQKALDQSGGKADFVFVLADGIKADGSKIVSGIRSVLKRPFFGGLTGDDRKFTRSMVILNGKFMEDAVAILTASGDLSFVMNAASGWTPSGDIGKVEDCRCNIVKRISGLSAQAFMKEQLGKPLGEDDLGIIPLAVYREEDDDHFYLRTPSKFDPASGEITTFGSIEPGASVRVCTATRDEVIKGVKKAMEGIYPSGFKPAAAIVVSCAGRKWLMDDGGNEEVEQVLSSLGRKIPLIGFPSFGEISPFMDSGGIYTETYFHNVTFAICLLG